MDSATITFIVIVTLLISNAISYRRGMWRGWKSAQPRMAQAVRMATIAAKLEA